MDSERYWEVDLNVPEDYYYHGEGVPLDFNQKLSLPMWTHSLAELALERRLSPEELILHFEKTVYYLSEIVRKKAERLTGFSNSERLAYFQKYKAWDQRLSDWFKKSMTGDINIAELQDIHKAHFDLFQEYRSMLNLTTEDEKKEARKIPDTASGGKAGDDIKVTSETVKGKLEAMRDQVFICYSHKDKRWLHDLQTHLNPYVRNGSVTAWSDQQIAPGSKWLAEIKAALASTRVAVMLVTPNFLASDFIHEHELIPLLKETEKGRVRILWIPVRACAYKETPLKDYQAACDPDKPLANMKAERDKHCVKICEEIKKAVSD